MTVHTVLTSFNEAYWAEFDHDDIERETVGYPT